MAIRITLIHLYKETISSISPFRAEIQRFCLKGFSSLQWRLSDSGTCIIGFYRQRHVTTDALSTGVVLAPLRQ